jgi:aldose 1-epimerase
MRFAFLAALLLAAAPAAAQRVTVSEFGRLADGRAVHEYLLDGGTGLRVRVLDYGGIIRSIEAPDAAGHVADVALSLKDLAAIEKRGDFSAVIGRYANRLSGGGVMIDGVFYKLAAGPTGVISHGGEGNFAEQLWQARTVAMPGRAAVRLHLVDAAGRNGFPGTVTADVTISAGRDRSLRLDYRATTDAPTVINLTHHAYFNLAGAGSGAIDAQWIRVFADRYTPLDTKRLPTGAIDPVGGTALDLRRWAAIGPRIHSADPQVAMAHGFDHNWVLNSDRGKPPLAACMYDPRSGRAMIVRTDQPGVQIYSANGFDGSLTGGDGKPIVRNAGMAFETQHFADSPRALKRRAARAGRRPSPAVDPRAGGRRAGARASR